MNLDPLPELTAEEIKLLAEAQHVGWSDKPIDNYRVFLATIESRDELMMENERLREHLVEVEDQLSEAFHLLDGHLGDTLISRIKRVMDLASLWRKNAEELLAQTDDQRGQESSCASASGS